MVAGLVYAESGGNQYAIRYEPHWKYFYEVEHYAKLLHVTEETEKQGQKFSYGLAQIMGGVSRELGFNGYFAELCSDARRGLVFACRYLALQLDKHKDILAAVSAYNNGSGEKVPILKDQFKNQKYVDRVLSYQKICHPYFE